MEGLENAAIFELPDAGSLHDSQFNNNGCELVTVSASHVSLYTFEKTEDDAGWELDAQWENSDGFKKVKMADSRYGKIVALVDGNDTITIWEVRNRSLWPGENQEADLKMAARKIGVIGGFGKINCLAFNGDRYAPKLAIGTPQGVRVLGPSPVSDSQWQLQSKIILPDSQGCTAIEWLSEESENIQRLIIGTSSSFQIWSWKSQLMKWVLNHREHGAGTISCIATHFDSARSEFQIALGWGDTVKIFQLDILQKGSNLQVKGKASLQQEAMIEDLKWHNFGSWLAVSLSTGFLSIWRPNLLGEWKSIAMLNNSQGASS